MKVALILIKGNVWRKWFGLQAFYFKPNQTVDFTVQRTIENQFINYFT